MLFGKGTRIAAAIEILLMHVTDICPPHRARLGAFADTHGDGVDSGVNRSATVQSILRHAATVVDVGADLERQDPAQVLVDVTQGVMVEDIEPLSNRLSSSKDRTSRGADRLRRHEYRRCFRNGQENSARRRRESRRREPREGQVQQTRDHGRDKASIDTQNTNTRDRTST